MTHMQVSKCLCQPKKEVTTCNGNQTIHKFVKIQPNIMQRIEKGKDRTGTCTKNQYVPSIRQPSTYQKVPHILWTTYLSCLDWKAEVVGSSWD